MDLRSQAWETLELAWEGPILRVWLNRPEKRNALNGNALEEIATLFTALQSEFETRVIVLGGRGASLCPRLRLSRVHGGRARSACPGGRLWLMTPVR